MEYREAVRAGEGVAPAGWSPSSGSRSGDDPCRPEPVGYAGGSLCCCGVLEARSG